MFSKTKRFGDASLEFGNKSKNSLSQQRNSKSPLKIPQSPSSSSDYLESSEQTYFGEKRTSIRNRKSPTQISRSPSIQSARKRYKDIDTNQIISINDKGRMSVQLPKKSESKLRYNRDFSFDDSIMEEQDVFKVKTALNKSLFQQKSAHKNDTSQDNPMKIQINDYDNKENLEEQQPQKVKKGILINNSIKNDNLDVIHEDQQKQMISLSYDQKDISEINKNDNSYQNKKREFNQTLKKLKDIRDQQKQQRLSIQGEEVEQSYQNLLENFSHSTHVLKNDFDFKILQNQNLQQQQQQQQEQQNEQQTNLYNNQASQNCLFQKQNDKDQNQQQQVSIPQNNKMQECQIKQNPMNIQKLGQQYNIENNEQNNINQKIKNEKDSQYNNNNKQLEQQQQQNIMDNKLVSMNDIDETEKQYLELEEQENYETQQKENINNIYEQSFQELENEKLMNEIKQKDEKIKYLENELQQIKNYYQSKDRYQQDYLNNFLKQNLQLKADNETLKESQKILEQQHEQIIQYRGNLRIFCRIKPVFEQDMSGNQKLRSIEDQKIRIQINERHKQVVEIKNDENAKFFFDSVFDMNCQQEDIFNQTQPFIQCALNGDQVCIIAYGQTGTGKTYTMEGLYDKINTTINEHSGILPRTATFLFKEKEKLHIHRNLIFTVGAIEVYCEELRDLLQSDEKIQQKLEIVQQNNKIKVTNQVFQTVKSVEELLAVIKKSSQNRVTDKTTQNNRSSRSHCIYQIKIFENKIERGGIHIVDLAGSESFQATSNKRESSFINKSLTTLKRIITMLSDRSQINMSKIPYRESKLTRLIQDSIGGDSKTLIFVTVCPLEDNFIQTKESLKFISKATL